MAQLATMAATILVGAVVMVVMIATMEHPAIMVEVIATTITTTITAMVVKALVHQEHLGEISLNVPPGSLNLPNDSIIYALPDGGTVTGSDAPAGMCTTVSQWVDTCTGEAMGDPSGPIANGSGIFALSECPTYYDTPPTPCDEFIVNSGGVTCATDFCDW